MSRQVPDSTATPAALIARAVSRSSLLLPTPLSPVTNTAAVPPGPTSRRSDWTSASVSVRPTSGPWSPASPAMLGSLVRIDLARSRRFGLFYVTKMTGGPLSEIRRSDDPEVDGGWHRSAPGQAVRVVRDLPQVGSGSEVATLVSTVANHPHISG